MNDIEQILRIMDTKDSAHKAALIGQSAPGALYRPGERVTWISACAYGPYTSVVLGSEIQAVGIAYWCETAPESIEKPSHLANRYWVYPEEIKRAKKRSEQT